MWPKPCGKYTARRRSSGRWTARAFKCTSSGDEVRIYTRSLNEITAAIPEIAELARTFAEHTLVLDGEAIAFDASGRPHPFQVTMRRFGRKLNVEASRSALPIDSILLRLPALWRREHRHAHDSGALCSP